MAAPHSPIGSRRRLGVELRRLRNRSGMTLDEVAEQMTCSTSKISRLETGKAIPKVPDVRELMRIYGVDSDDAQDELLRLVHDGREQDWWEQLADGVRSERYVLDSPGRYAALENDATAASCFATFIVPGLLQTAEYGREVSTTFLPHHSLKEIDLLVKVRRKRQEALRRSDPPPLQLLALIDEAVLNRDVRNSTVMLSQLRHICAMALLPNVSIRILPFSAGPQRVHAGDFVILDIPTDLGSDLVFTESHAGDHYMNTDADVGLYKEIHAEAVRDALTEADSLQLIARYMDVYEVRARS